MNSTGNIINQGYAQSAQGRISSGATGMTVRAEAPPPAPPEPTVRQRLTDRAAHYKKELERAESLLRLLPDDLLRLKMREFEQAFYPL